MIFGTTYKLAIALATVTSMLVQTPYTTYYNARFDYSIAYPSNLMTPQGEATNGDGQRFISRDSRAEMLVYGANNALDDSLEKVFQNEIDTAKQPGRTITYKVLKRDWFVISGIDGTKVFYRKTFLRNGVFKTFIIKYDKRDRTTYDEVTTRIAASFHS